MLELEGGRGRYFKGSWHAWRTEKAQRELALGRAIERQQAEIERLERFVIRFRAGTRARQAQARMKQLAKIDRVSPAVQDGAGLRFAFEPPERSGRVVFELLDGRISAGDKVLSGEQAEPRVGNCLPLRRIPLGMSIHNLQMQPGHGGQLCRSAGTSATLTAREGKWAQITLPSGEVRRISSECRATIGAIGNADHMNISLGKAGRKRWLGRKPHNRGTSMNPVSHPMGGGEGRTAGGRHPCSPTGVLAKGGKTRKKRKPSNAAIIRRRRPGPHYVTK